MTYEEFMQEYERLAHAVQSGVAFGDGYESQEAKHLRTGLNLVMRDLGSLAGLLVKKGIITNDEFFEATLEGLKLEVVAEEARLSEQYGKPVRLV